MVDHEVNMIEEHHRIRILLSEIQDDLNNDHMISSIEAKTIDEIFDKTQPIEMEEHEICISMVEKALDSHFKMSIGATKPFKGRYVLDEYEEDLNDSSTTDETSSDSELDPDNEEELDAFMASATHAGKPKGISAEMLSKVWMIDLETARKTLQVTSQNCVH